MSQCVQADFARYKVEIICSTDYIHNSQLFAGRVVLMIIYSLLFSFHIFIVITFCQAVVRQNMASSKVEEMRQEKRIASVTIIQSRWRSYSTSVEYMHALLDVVAVQSAARKLIARRKLKEELNSIKNVAATRISSSWRGFICCSEYKQTVEGMCLFYSVGQLTLAYALICNRFER